MDTIQTPRLLLRHIFNHLLIAITIFHQLLSISIGVSYYSCVICYYQSLSTIVYVIIPCNAKMTLFKTYKTTRRVKMCSRILLLLIRQSPHWSSWRQRRSRCCRIGQTWTLLSMSEVRWRGRLGRRSQVLMSPARQLSLPFQKNLSISPVSCCQTVCMQSSKLMGVINEIHLFYSATCFNALMSLLHICVFRIKYVCMISALLLQNVTFLP